MKTQGKFIIRLVTVVMLLFQLMSPALAHADGETPPPPSETATPPVTPPPTDDSDETDTPTETAAPAPTESPTLEDPPGTPPPTDSSTPDTPSNTPAPTVTDSGSPTSDPVETGTPTQTPTRERTRRPTETTNSRFEPMGSAMEETIIIESSTPTQTPTETASPTEPVTVDNPTLLESVQAIPGETSVVVLDANGHPLPLVTQEAADIVVTGDPMWCPDGVAPGGVGCTSSYTSLATLLSDLGALNAGTGINADGTIWIESSYISSFNDSMATGFTLDGSILTTWANYSLTLQGGWDGVSGSTGLLSNSVFSVPITITNWKKKVKVNNLTINTNAGTAGLTVVTDGNINLSNINTTNSAGDGVNLDNSRRGRGNVTVNNLTINNNAGTGLTVVTNGDITLTGTNIFNGNGSIGLFAQASDGTITLSGSVTANSNGSTGADLLGANGVTLTGTNEFSGNGQTGLDALSNNGSITLNNSTASNNLGFGAFLTGANGVTLTGTNIFNDNGQTGLDAWSNNGDVTLNNITASKNLGYGASIHGTDVTLTGNSVFNENPFGGLVVYGSGNVTLNDVTADGNGIQSYGVIIFDSGNVYLTGGAYTGNGTGLYVECVESVTFNIPLTEIINNTVQDIYIDPTCPVTVTYPKPTIISISHSEKEFVLDCKSVDGFSVNLPNGDLVYIYCPVTGNARIARLDSTALPADLPAGFTYASAFSLDILQNKEPIDVITEGGSIKASFVGSSLPPGSTYSILYWDDGSWEPLEEFMLDVKGKPLAFDLNPGIPEDIRQILSGVELVTVNGLPRVEVSTNFPGIFVLAQR